MTGEDIIDGYQQNRIWMTGKDWTGHDRTIYRTRYRTIYRTRYRTFDMDIKNERFNGKGQGEDRTITGQGGDRRMTGQGEDRTITGQGGDRTMTG